jgi:hypothetical protein
MRAVGDVLISPGAQITVATLNPDASVLHTWGNWFVEGNLTVMSPSIFVFDGTVCSHTHERAHHMFH